MRVYIPSRSRAGDLHDGSLRHIPHGGATLVVPRSQQEEYTRAVRGEYPVIGLPDEWRIAEKRREIGRIAAESGEDRFMMVDDDLEFLVRKSDEVWNLRKLDGPREWRTMLGWVSMVLDWPHVTHAGLSAREGNNNYGVGSPLQIVERNTRLVRAYAWRTREFLELEHCRLSVMEDFDASLQSLRRGGENVALGYFASGQRATNGPGGCSDWRTLEVHNTEGAEALARLHPRFVSLRTKQNKTGSLAVRREVTISWKAAAASGKRAR